VEHEDHVRLLRDGVPAGGVWADLGSGGGAFTLALADLLGPGGTIYSVDRDGGALRRQEVAIRARFPDVVVSYIEADYTKRMELPALDGVVMANSLHFQRNRRKSDVLRFVYDWLKPSGRLLVVEYNTDRGNLWVPHPFSYDTWERITAEHGFAGTRLLATRPSRNLREIYSAVTFKDGVPA
jgi:ubiquinone/menaquinone biosynthesis C-methylase UbiE